MYLNMYAIMRETCLHLCMYIFSYCILYRSVVQVVLHRTLLCSIGMHRLVFSCMVFSIFLLHCTIVNRKRLGWVAVNLMIFDDHRCMYCNICCIVVCFDAGTVVCIVTSAILCIVHCICEWSLCSISKYCVVMCRIVSCQCCVVACTVTVVCFMVHVSIVVCIVVRIGVRIFLTQCSASHSMHCSMRRGMSLYCIVVLYCLVVCCVGLCGVLSCLYCSMYCSGYCRTYYIVLFCIVVLCCRTYSGLYYVVF